MLSFEFIETQRQILMEKKDKYNSIGNKIKRGTEMPNEILKHFVGLDYVVRALDKIKEGSYGFCDECGEKIPQARLEAVPGAVYCVDCLSRKERKVI